MEENLIHIFCVYLAGLLETQQFDLNDVWYISEQFKTVCENIKTRQDLVGFLDKHMEKYPEFTELQNHLLDINHKFI